MDENTPMWKLLRFKEDPTETIVTLRRKFRYSFDECKVILKATSLLPRDELLDIIRTGRVKVPSKEEIDRWVGEEISGWRSGSSRS
jgi:hypothetical protein